MVEVVLKLIVVYLFLVSPIDKLIFYALLLFFVQFSKIGLKHCMEAEIITSGMKVMISGFGVGLIWGGTIINFK